MARFQAVWRVCVAGAVLASMWATAEAGCHRRGGYGRWAGFGPPSLARLLAGGYHGGGRHQGGYGQPPGRYKRVQAASPLQPSQPAEAAPGETAEPSPSDEADVPEQQPALDSGDVAAGGQVASSEGGDASSAAAQADARGGEVEAAGLDVALVDVRLVSPAEAASGVGPVYRISVRNRGALDIAQPFQIAVLVGKANGAGTEAPVTAEVGSLAVGATATVDVQLDAALSEASPTGRRVYVVVDSQQQLAEADETNNLAELEMAEIQPLGPGTLRLVPADVTPGSELRIEGSGFGELPGRVVLKVNGVKLLAEVVSWSDTLVCVRLPALELDGPTTAQLAVLPPHGPAHDGLELRLASR